MSHYSFEHGTANGPQFLPHGAEIGKITGAGLISDGELFAHAANSYVNNCGVRAAECAEADLLGDALKLLNEVATSGIEHTAAEKYHSMQITTALLDDFRKAVGNDD